jgi:hypothetical protein
MVVEIKESQIVPVILEVEEEVQVEDYVFPVWGLIVVVGFWVFVLIMIVIGIIYSLSMKKKRTL